MAAVAFDQSLKPFLLYPQRTFFQSVANVILPLFSLIQCQEGMCCSVLVKPCATLQSIQENLIFIYF